MSDEQVASWHVGREVELATLSEALGRTSSNVYLWGERGVGKTFLLRLLRRELAEDQPRYLSMSASLVISAGSRMVACVESRWGLFSL